MSILKYFSLDFYKKNKPEQEQVSSQIEQSLAQKPYLSLKLTNDILTATLLDNVVLSKSGATKEDFEKCRNAISEREFLSVFMNQHLIDESKEKETEEIKRRKIEDSLDIFKTLSDFKVQDNSVIFNITGRSVPELLIAEFADIILSVKRKQDDINDSYDLQSILNQDNRYLSLKRFFLWACLNPRAEVADKLFDFLKENSFRITKQGFFTALRNVVTVETEDKSLVEFISNSYNKIKAVWKKNPKNFEVYKQLDQYILHKTSSAEATYSGKWIGNLEELYKKLPEMQDNRYTDDYTRTFDIRVGRVVSMPPEECSWSTADCAEKGLHFTSDQIHYVECGDTSVLVLINPMKVVGIGKTKGRCYEYLPIMTVPRNEATTILHDGDFDTLELDEDFAIKELENLSERVKEGFAKEVKKYEFNLPTLSSSQVEEIVNTLEEMKNSIDKRIVTLD